MPDLRLYNTLTRQKEIFEPEDDATVRMYCCGPTVYNYAHIGNLRTYIFEDILRRVLELKGWAVNHVVNITDVGHMTSDADAGMDKMAKAAQREGKSPWELAEFYEDAFLRDLARLNVTRPNVLPRATLHVPQMIGLIEKLIERGYVYQTKEGLYFDTARDADYGELAGLNFAGQREGAREEVNVDPDKKHPSDFILWFLNKPTHIMKWDSPWGIGYPGWHIECSAMSMEYLGETLDIHCGGIDHIPVHNTNEIAQSECATGQKFARFWIHGAFLNVKGASGPGHAKMAKSGDNFITVDRLIERGFDPLAYRYLTLTAHYRSELAFSWDSLGASRKALDRIYGLAKRLDGAEPLSARQIEQASLKVEDALFDDLNVPKAIAILHDFESSVLWEKFDSVLGLNYKERSELGREPAVVPEAVQALVARREEARAARRFDVADSIRGEIEELGFRVGDGIGGIAVVQKARA